MFTAETVLTYISAVCHWLNKRTATIKCWNWPKRTAGVSCRNVWNFAQRLKFMADFHSKMSVC